jgi:signal transduction histidine kinase
MCSTHDGRYRRSVDEALPLPFTQRLSARHKVAIDAVFALLVLVASIGGVVTEHHGGPTGVGWDIVRSLAITVACVAFVFRRRAPLVVLGVMTPAAVLLGAIGVRGPFLIVLAAAIYMVAATSDHRISLTIVGTVVGSVAFGALISDGGPDWGGALSGPAVVLVGWLAGENTRARRAYARGLAERAAEREREREERVRRAAADERVRIARELHDVVAHAMSVVAVRSGVARMVLDSQPEEAREALGIIETISRRALAEMRLLVGVLRQPEEGVAELGPAPGLGDLDELVGQMGEAGLQVAMHVEGVERPLPAGVDVSAYRIVQEALTNVVRHVGPANAELWIRYRPDEVDIEVTDDGGARQVAGSAAPLLGESGGHGLVGMRERVAIYGGELLAGPAGDGYRVLARIPTDEGEG